MTDPRHRAPPSSRPQLARWIWFTVVAGVALVAGTVALASWLGPSPEVEPAAPEPMVARSYAIRTLPPLNVPTPPAPTTATSEPSRDPLSAPVPDREVGGGVSVDRPTTVRRSTAPLSPRTAQPSPQLPPATVPTATTTAPPVQPTPVMPAPTTTEVTVTEDEPTPTATPEPTDVVPTDVVVEIVEDVVETPTATPTEEQP